MFLGEVRQDAVEFQEAARMAAEAPGLQGFRL